MVCIYPDRLVLQTWECRLVVVHVPHMRSREAVEPIWPYPLECGGLGQSPPLSELVKQICQYRLWGQETENIMVWKQKMEK